MVGDCYVVFTEEGLEPVFIEGVEGLSGAADMLAADEDLRDGRDRDALAQGIANFAAPIVLLILDRIEIDGAVGNVVFGELDPTWKSGGVLLGLHCLCLELDGACECQCRVPTFWIIEPVDVFGYGGFSVAS